MGLGIGKWVPPCTWAPPRRWLLAPLARLTERARVAARTARTARGRGGRRRGSTETRSSAEQARRRDVPDARSSGSAGRLLPTKAGGTTEAHLQLGVVGALDAGVNPVNANEGVGAPAVLRGEDSIGGEPSAHPYQPSRVGAHVQEGGVGLPTNVDEDSEGSVEEQQRLALPLARRQVGVDVNVLELCVCHKRGRKHPQHRALVDAAHKHIRHLGRPKHNQGGVVRAPRRLRLEAATPKGSQRGHTCPAIPRGTSIPAHQICRRGWRPFTRRWGTRAISRSSDATRQSKRLRTRSSARAPRVKNPLSSAPRSITMAWGKKRLPRGGDASVATARPISLRTRTPVARRYSFSPR